MTLSPSPRMPRGNHRRARAKGAYLKASAAGACLAAIALASSPAGAQQNTFHLDRLEVPGAPEDGLVLFRPVTHTNTIIYGQIGLGYVLDPLRMQNITQDPGTLRASASNAISNQFISYFSTGFELFDRLTLGGTYPVTWVQTGDQENVPGSNIAGAAPGTTAYQTAGPSSGEVRFDARYVYWRNEERSINLGAQVSVFVPSGTTSNFGGDGGDLEAMPMLTGEVTVSKKIPVAIVLNTGVQFRSPHNIVNDPAGQFGRANGLGIGDEWRYALGAFLPLAGGRFRVGVDIFGQTGITNDNHVGNTIFTKQNTPLEWDAEGRMKLPIGGSDHWYVGAGGGSVILTGYGAPDFRFVGLFGTYFEIKDTDANSPEGRMKARASIREALKDSDGDGIPDDVDACPTEPEDHKEPDPGDGCPAPSDRDGDGIPDQYDKCPDQPEDKDGVDDQDGCPEDDSDQDGIPDAKDACPKEPGQPDPDPKKNGCPKFIKLEGSTVRVLQQVHFATGSATILPDSFPMLTEIAKLLLATPAIKRMMVEGHTDDRGDAAMNLDLSKRRAASVVTWLIQHGVDSGRLSSQGFGEEKPIETNATNEGRQANRRVEFHITEEDTGTSAPKGDMDSGKKPPGD